MRHAVQVGLSNEAMLIVDRLLCVNDHKTELLVKPFVFGKNSRRESNEALIGIIQAGNVLAGFVEFDLS